MTAAELQAKREEILGSVGLIRVTFSDGRSVEYSQPAVALAAIDREIAKASPGDKVFTIQTDRGLQ